jgi:LysR family carnitine catabolism transcriptional activator
MSASIRQFRAFLALSEHRSFTRAARQMNVSQPAFSELIKSLEDQLGLRLFDRSTRSVQLSVEGQDFIASAQQAVDSFDGALSSVRDTAALRRGRVSIALLPSLAAAWLPDVLRTYRKKYPSIQVDVWDVLSERCIEFVAAGSADMALAAVRADTPDILAERFCADDFYLVCKPDHPLAEVKSLRIQDLQQYPFVHLARTSSVRQYLEAAFHPRTMNSVMEVEQLATVVGMVSAGLGISVIPALALFYFKHPGIVTRRLTFRHLKRQIFLARRRHEALSLPAQALYQMMFDARPRQSAG